MDGAQHFLPICLALLSHQVSAGGSSPQFPLQVPVTGPAAHIFPSPHPSCQGTFPRKKTGCNLAPSASETEKLWISVQRRSKPVGSGQGCHTNPQRVSEQGWAFPAAGLCTALLPPSSPFHMHEMDFTHSPQPSWLPDLTNEQQGPVERKQRAWFRLCNDISPTQQNVTPTGSKHGPRFQWQPWFALLERGCTQTLPATWRKTRACFAEQAEGLANTPEKLNNRLIWLSKSRFKDKGG